MKTVKNTCNYKEVCDTVKKNNIEFTSEKLSRSNIIRQLLVSSTIWTLYFIYGLQIGAPTVIIPQMKKEANSSTIIDDELGSWLTSMFPVGALPWTLILPIILEIIGRKKTYILISTIGFIGALTIYMSKSITHILVGEFVLGIILGSLTSTSPFIITEYSSSKYRGLFLTIKSASGFWGLWVSNIIGTFCHWKNIYLVLFLCNAYTLLATVFAWPESPFWLARERRFDDCANNYVKLNGSSISARRDLEFIIKSYEYNEDINEEPDRKALNNVFSSYFKLLSSKSYYCPLLLAVLLGVQYHLIGKLICSMYAIQILKKITQNEAMAYKGMLILDGVTVFGAYCGCIVSRYCKRRTMLFTTTFMSVMFLYILSLYLFLVRQSIIVENNIISITLLAFFSVTVCSGPMILLTSIYGELISFRHQRSSAMIFGFTYTIVMIVSLKTSLILFKQLTLPGAFLFFAIVSTIISFTLYFYLPETKNKSFHEIENYFKGHVEKK